MNYTANSSLHMITVNEYFAFDTHVRVLTNVENERKLCLWRTCDTTSRQHRNSLAEKQHYRANIDGLTLRMTYYSYSIQLMEEAKLPNSCCIHTCRVIAGYYMHLPFILRSSLVHYS